MQVCILAGEDDENFLVGSGGSFFILIYLKLFPNANRIVGNKWKWMERCELENVREGATYTSILFHVYGMFQS